MSKGPMMSPVQSIPAMGGAARWLGPDDVPLDPTPEPRFERFSGR